MKISVVMQSYLGDYPGSRKDPKNKFIRAVASFLNQTHEDKELLIVSDGCEDTKKLYELFYYDNKQIKFCYLAKDKNTESMYQEKNNITNFRGLPRRLGVSMATGDIISYFDSDDIMLPNRLSDLNQHWEKARQDTKWISNPLRYLHISTLEKNNLTMQNFQPTEPLEEINLQDYGYKINEKFYLNCAAPPGHVFCGTIAISHRKNAIAVWNDTQIVKDLNGNILSGISEDRDFFRQLQALNGPGLRRESRSLVVCHCKDLWDI